MNYKVKKGLLVIGYYKFKNLISHCRPVKQKYIRLLKMDFAESGARRGVPKFSEILRRPRGEAEVTIDSPDLDFIYDDSDSYDAEMAELYSYSEEPEFFVNKKFFDETAIGLG